jgi:hypothetical protein
MIARYEVKKPTCGNCAVFLRDEEILNAIYWNTIMFGTDRLAEATCEKCEDSNYARENSIIKPPHHQYDWRV